MRDVDSLDPRIDSCAGSIVVGLETIRGPAALAAILSRVEPGCVVFSLDLRAGRPLTAPGSDWGGCDPLDLALRVADLGVRRVLLLDLAHVGTGQGIGTRRLLGDLKAVRPGLDIAVGGGISGVAELDELAGAGASAVLIGSALHDGRISPEGLIWFRDRSGGCASLAGQVSTCRPDQAPTAAQKPAL